MSADFLFIDDEEIVLNSLARIASLENYSFECAATPSAALALAKGNSYKAAICDLMLPEMSGLEVFTALRQQDFKSPFVLSTGYSTLENAVTALKQGAFDFLPKPFEIPDVLGLFARITRYVELGGQVTRPAFSRYALGLQTWAVRHEGNSFRVGAGESISGCIDGVASIEPARFGAQLEQGTLLARVHTNDGHSHSLWSPLRGQVLAINDVLMNTPGLLLSTSYPDAWILEMAASGEDALDHLARIEC